MIVDLPKEIGVTWVEALAARCEDGAGAALTLEIGSLEDVTELGEARLLQLAHLLRQTGRPIVLNLGEPLPEIEEAPRHRLWKFFTERLGALILTEAAERIVDPEGNDRRAYVSSVQAAKLAAAGGELGFGRERALVRIDRPGAPRAFRAFDRKERAFSLVGNRVKQLLAAINLAPIGPDQLERLATFAYEAIENTLVHARDDLVGTPINGARFMQIRRRELPREPGMDRLVAGEGPLDAYLERLSSDEELGDERVAHFVELTVADCGVGIPARLGDSMGVYDGPVAAEEEKALEAMRAGTSSQRSVMGSGQGLSNAIEMVELLRGIFIVRTGRLELIRDAGGAAGGVGGWHVEERRYLPGTSLSLCVPWWSGAQGRLDVR